MIHLSIGELLNRYTNSFYTFRILLLRYSETRFNCNIRTHWYIMYHINLLYKYMTVFRRESPFTGQGVSIENLSANELSVSITELNAFTEYEFAVSAATVAGATLSEFVRITTLEAGEFMRTSAPCNGTSLHHKII